MTPSSGPDRLPLIGRVVEREAIRSVLEASRQGSAGVMVLEGEAGLGKSALVRSILDDLPVDRRVEWIQADEFSAMAPFELARRMGATSDEAFRAGLEILDGWSDRQDGGPLVVMIEDLHWWDPESSKALLCAVQRLGQDRVAVIVTTRPGLHGGWDRLAADPDRCCRVVLQTFDVEEVAQMASSTGVDLTPSQAQRLRDHTGGHPLYVRTLLAELRPEELRLPGGDLPAPLSLRSAITARLSETPEASRELAAAMAVLNQRLPLAVVGQVARIDSPVEAFEDLLPTGFVEWERHDAGLPVRFAHPLHRQSVYEDLSPRRRRDLHRVAAEWVGENTALAHRLAAADGSDEDLARDLEDEAGRLLAEGRKPEAAQNFRWASSLSTNRAEVERRLLQAAWAYADSHQIMQVAGMRAEIESCADSLDRSLVLGLLNWEGGRIPEAREWLGRVVAASPKDDAGTRTRAARAWAELAEIDNWLLLPSEAARAADRALELSSPHTSAERMAWTHRALAEGHALGPGAGLALLRSRLAVPPPDVTGEDIGLLVTRATLALQAGIVHAALDDLRAVLALTRSGFVPVELARTHRQLATALMVTGEWGEALVQARTGLGVAIDRHHPTEMAACHSVTAMLLAYRGETDEAGGHVAAARKAAGDLGFIEATGLAALAAAMVDEVCHRPGEVVVGLESLVDAVPMLAGLAFWPVLVRALIEVGPPERAEASIDGLAAAAARRGLAMEARLTGLRGRLALDRGDTEGAEALLISTLDRFGPDDPVLEQALACRDLGRTYLARGARELAADTLQEAHGTLTSLGAAPFVALLDVDIEAAGRRPKGRSERSPRGLTERERDVAVLVANGYSNPEVAAELYVSRKAVEYHLSNIYGKLGLRSRRQLRGLSF